MRKFLLPCLLMLSLIACCIEVEISAPGFPAMQRYFSVSEIAVQLTIAFNLLGFCIAAFFYGPLSDAYGRRKIMIAGNFIMLIGASMCVFAPTIDCLYIARFIQGLGAATSAVVVFAMVADNYKGEQSVKILGLFNAVFTTLIAIAPIVGSFINEAIGWRGNYALVAIVTGIAWIAILMALPETHKNFSTLNLKKIMAEYRQLLSSKLFMSTAVVPSLLYAIYMVFITCSAFLYIKTFGLSEIHYGLHLAFIIVVFAFVSLCASKITAVIGRTKSIIGSLTMMMMSLLTMIILNSVETLPLYLITFCMSLYCIGSAILYPIIFSQSLEIFPNIKGIASAFIMSLRTLLMAGLTGFAGLMYNGTAISIVFVLFLILVVVVALTGYIVYCGSDGLKNVYIQRE